MKTLSLEESQIRQPRAGAAGRKAAQVAPVAKGAKLSPARRKEPAGLLEEHFPDSEARAVRFEYFNLDAREVLVAGSFNDWQPLATPMTNLHGDRWSAELRLKPGHYEYRFVVDGQWMDDPMAACFVANPFGSLNCVLEVKATEAGAASQP